MLKQAWAVGRQAHDHMAGLLFHAGWSMPLGILVIIASIPFWRGAVAEAGSQVAQQVDYEDTALCVKFGFAEGSQRNFSCKLDLLDLRRNDERLTAGYSIL